MPCFRRRTLASGEKVTRVAREWHTRKSGAYVIQDRYRKVTILSQRLSLIASYLNEMAEDHAERVSVPALFNAVGKDGTDRVAGHCKNRWKVSLYSLDEAPLAYEGARGEHETAVILGADVAYKVCHTVYSINVSQT